MKTKSAPAPKEGYIARYGHITVKVRAHHTGGWRFRWLEDGAWKAAYRKDRAEAVAAADAKAKELSGARVDDFRDLDRETLDLARRVIEGGYTNKDIDLLKTMAGLNKASFTDASEDFLATLKRKAGSSHHHLRNNSMALRRMARKFGKRMMHEITTEELEKWLDDLGDISKRHRKNYRDVMVGFFKWARNSRRHLPDMMTTAAERIEAIKVPKKTPTTYSVEEMKIILREVRPAYMPWVVLGAFAGIRVEEVFNNPLGDKEPLDWSDFLWSEGEHGIIRIRPEVSKTNTLRLIPIHPTVRAWLYPIRKEAGRLVPKVLPHVTHGGGVPSETRRIGDELPRGWLKNAMRHSYISYRAAEVGMAVAAMEAGNSEAMTRKAYLVAKTAKEAAAYFALTPDVVNGKASKGAKIIPMPTKRAKAA